MRAKFGRSPTVVSKKGSLKFISRLAILMYCFITRKWNNFMYVTYSKVKQYTMKCTDNVMEQINAKRLINNTNY